MDRPDIDGASYGGGPSKSGKRPVIITHGTLDNANNYYEIKEALMAKGWAEEDIFATTYGPGVYSELAYYSFTQRCDYVLKIRRLIQAVAQYRNQTVDFLGYSLGAPVGRKAILGGYCVDKEYNLGTPITKLINVYMSIAGSHWGSGKCFAPLPIVEVCNSVNGVYCGATFFQDINSPNKRYEGKYSFSIASQADDVIMNSTVCGHHPAVFKNTKMIWYTTLDHQDTLMSTVNKQIKILKSHQ